MLKLRLKRWFVFLLPLFLVAPCPVIACTDFVVAAKDGTRINARSMEWAADLHTRLCFHPRHEKHPAPDGSEVSSWEATRGFIALDAYGDRDITVDGMNEVGLSVGALWMPGTKYLPDNAKATASNDTHVIPVTQLVEWILGTADTVDGAIQQLQHCRIHCTRDSRWGGIPTLHLAIHDPGGKNAVVEWIDGIQHVYENPNGVLTNAPPFDWHMTNLRNYINVSARNPHPVQIAGSVLEPPGQGGGFLGIPGDWTPPSRFVRTTAMLSFAMPSETSSEALLTAQHTMNAVDIPRGDVRAGDGYTDYTQWSVFKDMTNKIIYFRSYDDLTMRAVDLKKLNFDDQDKNAIPITQGAQCTDVTNTLQ